jgi:transposase
LTLRRWFREEASRPAGRAAQTASEKDRLKLLEREELDRQGKW